MPIIDLVVVQTLSFYEQIFVLPKFLSVSDTLSLTESISTQLNHRYMDDRVYFREYIYYSFANKHYSFTDTLNYSELIAKQLDLQQFYDTLHFNESLAHTNGSEQYVNNLTFTETIQYSTWRPRQQITDTLTLNESIYYYIFNKNKKQVSVNSQNLGTVTPAGYCPIYVHVYPYISFQGINGSAITLNAPDFGNSDNLNLGRINRRSRGGDLILKRIPLSPRSNNLKHTVHIYNSKDKETVRQFFKKNWGQLLTLTDHEGINYQGILLNTPEFIEENDCFYKLDLEFVVPL